jgi:hypothetical protein
VTVPVQENASLQVEVMVHVLVTVASFWYLSLVLAHSPIDLAMNVPLMGRSSTNAPAGGTLTLPATVTAETAAVAITARARMACSSIDVPTRAGDATTG